MRAELGLAFTAAGAVGVVWVHLAMVLPRLRQLANAPAVASSIAGPLAATWLAVAIALPAIVSWSGVGTGIAAERAAALGLTGGAIVIDRGPASPAFAGLSPVHAALAGIGIALLVGVVTHSADRATPSTSGESRPGLLISAAALAGATLVLFVVGLERHLPMMLGQLAFAMLAVLFWMVGPTTTRPPEDRMAPAESAAGSALLLAVGLGLAQGVAARVAIAGSDGLIGRLAAGLIFGQVAILTAAAATLPAGVGRRAAAWCGVVGVLGGIGTLTLVRMPAAVRGAMAGDAPSSIVAGGFGSTLAEAAALGLAAAAVLLPDRGWAPRTAGVACLAFALVGMAERLLG
ncbi:MAG: hypothetical protein AB8G96_16730 [Phycisphaerales bacterium]